MRRLSPAQTVRRKVTRMSGLLDEAEALFSPNPGGGSVTVNGQTTYVDSAGLDSSTQDPSAGASFLSDPFAVLTEDVQGVASAATGGIIASPQDPTSGLSTGKKIAIGAAAAAVLLLLLKR